MTKQKYLQLLKLNYKLKNLRDVYNNQVKKMPNIYNSNKKNDLLQLIKNLFKQFQKESNLQQHILLFESLRLKKIKENQMLNQQIQWFVNKIKFLIGFIMAKTIQRAQDQSIAIEYKNFINFNKYVLNFNHFQNNSPKLKYKQSFYVSNQIFYKSGQNLNKPQNWNDFNIWKAQIQNFLSAKSKELQQKYPDYSGSTSGGLSSQEFSVLNQQSFQVLNQLNISV